MIVFYHLACVMEDPAIVVRAGAQIRHLHMANPNGRVFPRVWQEYDYAPFLAALRKIGYEWAGSASKHRRKLFQPGRARGRSRFLRGAFLAYRSSDQPRHRQKS